MGGRKGHKPLNTFQVGMPHNWKFTPKRQATYLDMLSKTGIYSKAIEIVGMTYAGLKSHRHRHPEFRELEAAAMLHYQGVLETAANEQAVIGVEDPIYQKGEFMGFRRKLDGNLLQFLLRAVDPSKYRENRAEINITGGVLVVPEELSAEEWTRREDARMKEQIAKMEKIEVVD